MTFNGNKKVTADSLSSDSFLVTLECKTVDPIQTPPPKYSFTLRGLDPVEKALFQDAQGGQWKNFDLFRAAMVAEGIRDLQFIRSCEARLNAVVEMVRAAVGKNPSPQTLTQALFEAMHKEILTQSYSLDCTELSKVMKTGHFNCVSATVLFNCLAEKAELNVCALEMPGHALSRVKFADGHVMDLETTCPTWFELQSEKERQMATLLRIAAPVPGVPNPVTAQNAVPATPEPEMELPTDRREISPVQLVATVYYNIGVDLHAKKCHPEAAAANIKALYLDKGNEQAWTNLLVAINNWALDVASEKKGKLYDLAVTLYDQGVALDPTYANFRSNYVYVFYHWIHGLASLGRFDDARKVFAHAEERVPGNKGLLDLIESVNQDELRIKKSRGQ
jgi:tetratricopeptide (TPR) repeat protein